MSHTEYAEKVFGLNQSRETPVGVALEMPPPGKSLAIIGPSGSGKTLALQRMVREYPGAIELKRLSADQLSVPVLENFPVDASSERAMRLLARVGLADGRLWSRCAGALSAGEQRRLEIALALAGPGALVIDEFDAHLDATTSKLMAQNLRRLGCDRSLIVSTHRPETLPYLQPTRVIEIDRGATELNTESARDMQNEIEIVPGRVKDYAAFARWHYLGPGRPGPSSHVWLAMHGARPVGIVMLGYPHLLLGARKNVRPELAPANIQRNGAKELNAKVRLLQRVIVEPCWRGIGLAQRLIRHALKHVDVSMVECIAQMGAFSDFLTRAGFEYVCNIKPPACVVSLVRAMAENNVAERELLDPGRRAAILKSCPQVERRLRAVVRSRIETGHGSKRGRGEITETLTRKCLSRLHACPGYYVWTGP